MAVILELKFPAGRYHATPWGRHVNEGVPEWPPSPWRLLRALVATWRRKCPELGEAVVREVLTALAEPPLFHLPPARAAHTRHYVPWEKKGPQDRTLVFDTFVSVDREAAVTVGWPGAALGPEAAAALAVLARNLTSLGRAESWVAAEVAGGAPDWNCVPAAEAREGELVPVFCADPRTAFGDQHYPRHDPRKLRKGLAPGELLFDCPRWHLCIDTETVHKERWPGVPGAMWVSYARRADALNAAPLPVPGREQCGPTVAHFALDGAVLPPVTETVLVAEEFRKALLRSFRRAVTRRLPGLPEGARPETHPELRSATFTGRDAEGMIRGSQGHAYYLPADEDGDGRVDHVTVAAANGFCPDEEAALDAIRRCRVGEAEVRVALVRLGRHDEFSTPLFGPSRVWESATPFVVTRHAKDRGRRRDPDECLGVEGRRAFARLVLGEELGRDADRWGGLPAVAALEQVRTGTTGRTRVLAFRRARQQRFDDGYRRAAGAFRLEFPRPVRGPICLGHGAHYGLGLFRAASG